MEKEQFGKNRAISGDFLLFAEGWEAIWKKSQG
jgi:hypothetical protein